MSEIWKAYDTSPKPEIGNPFSKAPEKDKNIKKPELNPPLQNKEISQTKISESPRIQYLFPIIEKNLGKEEAKNFINPVEKQYKEFNKDKKEIFDQNPLIGQALLRNIDQQQQEITQNNEEKAEIERTHERKNQRINKYIQKFIEEKLLLNSDQNRVLNVISPLPISQEDHTKKELQNIAEKYGERLLVAFLENFDNKEYKKQSEGNWGSSFLHYFQIRQSKESEKLNNSLNTHEKFTDILKRHDILKRKQSVALKKIKEERKNKMLALSPEELELREKNLSAQENAIEDQYNTELSSLLWGGKIEDIIRKTFENQNIPEGRSAFIRKVQSIGKYYFGDTRITVDGQYGPQTQAILELIKEDEALKTGLNIKFINEFIAKNRTEQRDKRSKVIKEEIKENYLRNNIEKKEIKKEKTQKEQNKAQEAIKNNDSSAKNETEKKATKAFYSKPSSEVLNKQLASLSESTIDAAIPTGKYLEAIKWFLKGRSFIKTVTEVKKNSTKEGNIIEKRQEEVKLSETEINSIAAEILEGEIKDESVKYSDAWKNSPEKQELINNFKKEFITKVNFESNILAVDTAKRVLEQMGEQIETGKVEPEKWIVSFQSKDNKDICYLYDIKTGKISVRKAANHDPRNKSIDLKNPGDELIMNLPNLTTLVEKAHDIKSYLPYGRLQNQEEFNKKITQELNNKIDYTLWAGELWYIRNNIEANKQKHSIINSLKKLLDTQNKDNLTEQGDRAHYQILAPIINSLENSNHPEEREGIYKLFQAIDGISSDEKQNTQNNKEQEKTWPESSAENKEISLLQNPHKIFERFKEQWVRKKLKEKGNNVNATNFEFWVFITSLIKEGESDPQKITLDSRKINFFLNKTENGKENDPQLEKRYTKTVEKIDNIENKEELIKKEKEIDNLKKTWEEIAKVESMSKQ